MGSELSRHRDSNCKDPEARMNSSVLKSRQDASVAEVGRDVVKEGGRDHILGGIASQSMKLAFYSKHNPNHCQVLTYGETWSDMPFEK